MLTACAHCHRRFVVSDDSVGKAAQCKYCGERFLIAPRESDSIGLVGDDEELGKSLRLPTLEDIEEALDAPDVGGAPAPAKGVRGPVPGVSAPVDVTYLDGQQTTAVVLLLLWISVAAAYGFWSAGNPPASVIDAHTQGLAVQADAWERVWRPLMVGYVTVLAIAGGLFWLGAQMAARLMRVRYSTWGIVESLAIAAVPISVPLLAAMCFGAGNSGVTITAMAVSLPIVCLLVPSLFGFPMAKGLTAATVCIGLAVPGYLGATLWAKDFAARQVARDDQRIARMIVRLRQERDEQPVVATPATLPTVPVAAAPLVQEARALAKEMLPPPMPGVPQVPPAVAAELENQATTRVVVPAAPVASSEANAPAMIPQSPPVSATVAAEAKSPLRPCRQIGSPEMVIWPAVSGGTFLCVKPDAYANHAVEVWSADPLQRVGVVRLGGGANVSYAVCPAGETLLRVVNGASPCIELWSLSDGGRRWQVPLTVGQAEPRVLGYFDKQTAGVLWQNGPEAMVDVLDLRRGAVKKTLVWPSTPGGSGELTPHNVVITPDGKGLAVVDSAQHLRLVDVATGSTRRQFVLNLPKDRNAEVTQIAFSPDGLMVAVLLDEAQTAGKSALFWGAVGDAELASVSVSEPLWRQAGCARTAGRRVGHVMDWLNPGQVLLYGELVMDLQAGLIIGSVHPREVGRAAGPAASGQHRLADGSFLLEYPPIGEQQGKRPVVQRLLPESIPQ